MGYENRMNSRGIRVVVAALAVAFAGGCATYGSGVNKALDQIDSGNYDQARTNLEKNLDPDGEDRLLYFMEFGTLEHRAGNYEKSVRHFEKAERIAEKLYTASVTDELGVLMSNPRNRDYSGYAFEHVYINYYKALNFLMLAQSSEGGQRLEHLDAARVELRRLDFKLADIATQEGNYQNVKDEDEKTFAKLLNVFDKLRGKWIDEDWLVFRDGAWLHYFTGVLYELENEFDDARVSYQKAATLYEEGYAKQYSLSDEVIEQAWFDTIRMMRRDGGWEGEWPRLAERKLDAEARSRLDEYDRFESEIVVIQHLGRVPQRKEMNLWLRADSRRRSLVLDPILSGSEQERRDQLSWFFLLYADTGLFDLAINYSQRGLYGAARGLTQKSFFLGPAWQILEELDVADAIDESGVRVTVPYYSPLRSPYDRSVVSIDGRQVGTMREMETVAQLALQNQLLNASADMHAELARATMKSLLAHKAGEQNVWAGLAGKIYASASTAAETRNWLTLPERIRIRRIPVSPGEHTLTVDTYAKNNQQLSRNVHKLDVEAGEIRCVVERPKIVQSQLKLVDGNWVINSQKTVLK